MLTKILKFMFLFQDFCFVIKEKTREMDTETHFKVFSAKIIFQTRDREDREANIKNVLTVHPVWQAVYLTEGLTIFFLHFPCHVRAWTCFRTLFGCSARTTKAVFPPMKWSLCSSTCPARLDWNISFMPIFERGLVDWLVYTVQSTVQQQIS